MIKHLLNQTIDVHRRQTESDGMGGQTVTQVQVGSYRAKVDQASLQEQQIAAQWGNTHTHDIYFSPGTDIQRDDILKDGNRTFLVIGTTHPSHNVYLKAECELRQSGI